MSTMWRQDEGAVLYAVRHGWLVTGDQANADTLPGAVDAGDEAGSSPA